jgi:thiazole synthase ThiGH ThiG subunit
VESLARLETVRRFAPDGGTPEEQELAEVIARHVGAGIDAGLGAPSQAGQAMELGYDACLLNTAVAKAADPPAMAAAFAKAIEAGREAYRAGLMEPRDMAQPSSPVEGLPALGGYRP